MPEKHLSTQFDSELNSVSSRVMELGGLVVSLSDSEGTLYCESGLSEEQWLAVLVSEQILDELHIHNIFVPLAMQRRGHARAVLQTALAEAQAAGATRCLLEVRAGNAAAIGLYRALGFVDCGVRKGYYRHEHGREDALLMECPLS